MLFTVVHRNLAASVPDSCFGWRGSLQHFKEQGRVLFEPLEKFFFRNWLVSELLHQTRFHGNPPFSAAYFSLSTNKTSNNADAQCMCNSCGKSIKASFPSTCGFTRLEGTREQVNFPCSAKACFSSIKDNQRRRTKTVIKRLRWLLSDENMRQTLLHRRERQ